MLRAVGGGEWLQLWMSNILQTAGFTVAVSSYLSWSVSCIHWWASPVHLAFLLMNSSLVPCWREGRLSDDMNEVFRYKIFLLLYNRKTTLCIFCNTVSCHDKHWNSMLNSCLYFNIINGENSPSPPTIWLFLER